jgi:hypothetical protein
MHYKLQCMQPAITQQHSNLYSLDLIPYLQGQALHTYHYNIQILCRWAIQIVKDVWHMDNKGL